MSDKKSRIGVIGIDRLKILGSLEEMAKTEVGGKIKVEPNEIKEEIFPKLEIPGLEEKKDEKPFRPDRKNKGHRPIF